MCSRDEGTSPIFQEIAHRLNKARYKNGGKDDLTDNAIYSRYTRNAPLIAQRRNEKFVPTAKVRFFGIDSNQNMRSGLWMPGS